MDNEIKFKQYVIREYYAEESYETLGVATGKNEEDAIEAFLSRKSSRNLNKDKNLTADEIIEVDNGNKKS